MQSQQPFARRAALAVVVLISLLPSSWGTVVAARPSLNDTVPFFAPEPFSDGASQPPNALSSFEFPASSIEQPSPIILQAMDVAVQAGNVYTWTQDTRADWAQGTLENLDGDTVSGTLQLPQRYFSVNEMITPRDELASGQHYPDIAIDTAGNAYAVWYDYRNDNADIYFAYRPAGEMWGANIKVNDDVGTASQSSPVIAVDGAGNAYAVWIDNRNGNYDIYFAYRPAGEMWGANIKVNDDVGTASQSSPAIAVDGAGNAYAVWYDYRNDNADIYSAYRPAGGTWGANIKVNDDVGTASQSSPAIAVDVGGNAYAVWTDNRNGNYDIYFAYRPAGGVWSTNVKVSDDPGTEYQSEPDIAVDSAGNAYAVWTDLRNGGGWQASDIYFAYRPVRGAWGANVKVNDDPDTAAWQYAPAIGVDGAGNAYTVWQDTRNSVFNIYFAHRPAGGAWGVNIRVDDDTWAALQIYPAIGVDGAGNAYAVWSDDRNGRNWDWDIYFAYHPAEGAWGANVKVNDDPGTASQGFPLTTTDGAGNAYAVWEDRRNGDSDIYFAYLPVGGAWGANILVNDDAGTASQSNPAIAVDGVGNVYAVWSDYRDGNSNIYFAYRPAGGVWGVNVKVNDDPGTTYQSVPAIAVDGAGNAYAVWSDYRNGNPDIYFAYRPAGGAWGVNVKVSDDPGTAAQGFPATAVDVAGSAYVVWHDERNGNPDIYFAYRPAGGAWGANVKVNDDPGMAYQGAPAIAVDGGSNAYAVWQDNRNVNSDIYFAYRPASGAWGANILVNDDAGTASQSNPAIAVNGAGNAYAVWSDYRNGNPDIYFAYRPAGGAWGTNILVNDDAGTASQSSPAIAVDGAGNAYAVWDDQRNDAHNLYFAHSLPAPEYHTEGVYTSPALDTGVTAAILDSLAYSAALPAGTALTFETRSRVAGGAWSAWQIANGAIASPPGQYFQYRVTFTTPVTDATPVLDWVKISYTSVGTPSAPRFATPCGVTNQVTPTLKGSAVAGSIIHLYVDGAEVLTTTTGANGMFAVQPNLSTVSHIVTATASNTQGAGPASAPLALTVDPALAYDPLNVRAGQWSKDGWLLSPPRDAQGCANSDSWQVWPRRDEKFIVQVPVSFTTSAAVSVTVGMQTITLTEGTGKMFAGVFQPLLAAGAFVIVVNADGQTTTVNGGPVLIDPDGFVYETSGTISDTIPGVQVTCYYSDTHSGQWLVWNAWNYDSQINPQITLDDGYYSFYTPPGTYRVVAEKDGYTTYTSPDLVVISTPVRHNIPLEMPTACPAPLTGVGIVGPLGITSTLYINTLYTFQTVITPAGATLPITYTWTPTPETGQGTDSVTYRWNTPDTYTVTLRAENCGGPITTTRSLTIQGNSETLIYLPLVLRNH